MKTKLHFGILIILMAFLGRYLETSVVPNQQIVVQFSDSHITEFETEKTIEAIQLKLQTIGIDDIQIGQDQEGQLKITYYSKADIQQIQDILSSEDNFKLTHNTSDEKSSNLPKQKKLKNYEINISEIQNSNNTNWDFEGVKIVELNHKSDRFDKIKTSNSSAKLNSELYNNLIKVSVKSNNNVALAIDNLSYEIPEVRAGPAA